MKGMRLVRFQPKFQHGGGTDRLPPPLPHGARAASPLLPDRIQAPDAQPSIPGLEIATATYPEVAPSGAVRGDFLDMFGVEGAYGFAWGWLSGCGGEVGPLITASKALVRATLISHPAVGATAHRLSRAFYSILSEGRSLALTFGLYDPDDRRFVVCNCGGWPPIVIGEGRTALVGPAGPPLGDFDSWRYPPAAITLAPGAALVGCTVGLQEARADGGSRGMTPLPELFERERSLPAFAQAILRTDHSGVQGLPPRDASVLVLRAVEDERHATNPRSRDRFGQRPG